MAQKKEVVQVGNEQIGYVKLHDLYAKEDYVKRMEFEMLQEELDNCQQYLN
jgi:hypothetical protein